MTKLFSLVHRSSFCLLVAGAALALGTAHASSAHALALAGEGASAEQRYTLKVEPGTAKAGKEATVKVSVTAKTPWHLNMEFPTALKLDAADGVTFSKDSLKKGDASTMSEGAIAFDVKLVAAAPGAKQLKGKLKFAICKAEACAPVTEDIVVSLNVAK